ncbi:helix-turn-helix transcriptional regulator [Cellvibrio fibrivorans]|uniref:Transcriptional regulator with XRE-family HTH domain n=2 Tax=Cellvibrio TaxID=10 RepID=A0ABU1V0M1_9GAMM|nr:helix-turn-helix transcriptional regulator [Cellvibrio fibrivorans]MDR7090984.1 transcriptional regulator with XRE-family HTH domain [Cellvibrio fibrivorans]
MNFYTMTNASVAAELGNRLEKLRLEQNMTQQALADEIGITAKSYRQLVAGSGKLENMVAALRALNALEQLENFLPATPPSPLEQLKLRGKQRQRARTTPGYKKTITTHTAEDLEKPGLDW